MTMVVDARGLACPQPVIKTRQAMQSADEVVTLVDSDTSLANVSRMAKKAGWQVAVATQGDEYRIEMNRAGGPSGPETKGPQVLLGIDPAALGRAEILAGPLVLMVSSDVLGRGSDELGQILMRSFFHTLTEAEVQPDQIIFINAGVRLACEGSAVLDDVRALEAQGIDILACGTCLGYYELKDALAVGCVSNMYDIAAAMLAAGKVVNL